MDFDFDVLAPTKPPHRPASPVDLLDLDFLSPTNGSDSSKVKVEKPAEDFLIDVDQSMGLTDRPPTITTPPPSSSLGEWPGALSREAVLLGTEDSQPELTAQNVMHAANSVTNAGADPQHFGPERTELGAAKEADDDNEPAFDFRDRSEKIAAAMDRASRKLRTDPVELVVPFCSVETLFALSTTNKKMHRFVVENHVWANLAENMNLSNADSGRAYECVLRFYLSCRPVLDRISNGHIPAFETATEASETICKCLALVPFIDADESLGAALESVANKNIEKLLDDFSYAVAHHEPLMRYFEAFNVWHRWGARTEIQNDVFKIYFADSVPALSIQDAFTYADNLETGEKQTSQRKIATVFNKATTFLITTMANLASPDSPLPATWRGPAWSYALTKVLSDLVVFVQDLLINTAQSISELEYLHTVIRVFHAAEVLTKNSVLHEKLDTADFNIQTYLETSLIKPMLDEFVDRQITYIYRFCRQKVSDWNNSSSQRETETEKFLWSSVPKKSEKSDFMSSLKWAFTTKRSDRSEEYTLSSDILGDLDNTAPATEFEAQTAVMVTKLKGMEKLVSFELALEVLEACRAAIQRLMVVGRASSKSAEPIFVAYLQVVGREHIQKAFEKAVKVLNAYDPKKYGRLLITPDGKFDNRYRPTPLRSASPEGAADLGQDFHAVEPLAVFTELVNIGDLVQQMVHVFFQEELVANKLVRPNNLGTQSVNSKRQFEQMLDDYLAEGLSRGIDVLMDQVEFTLTTEQLGSDYLPPPTSVVTTGQTAACEKVISLVKSHIDLLRNSTEKSLFDVFQQEVGMRLFAALSKHVKQQTISVDGAIRLIADANAYYGFIVSLKQKNLTPFFEALKQISQLFLIDKRDAKQLGLAIKDSARYGSVLTTEDIVEFVKRRKDWPAVKPVVNKVLYGLLDCVVC